MAPTSDRKPKRRSTNKRKFVQAISKKMKLDFKTTLEFVNTYSDQVLTDIRETGAGLIPNIGSVGYNLRVPKSRVDKMDALTLANGGSTGNFKKTYLKLAFKQAVREEHEKIVDQNTWNKLSPCPSVDTEPIDQAAPAKETAPVIALASS
ncbi:unnamed protein product [Prorocentrum cordatum]|uniref:Uncharacterized protein n=1 Tax=Prorocentrum cordatum TaxID=2364126 RepID=A0ABN9SFM3_9DINO|nr:unnamed protein product [Polarella glacialis]CAK0794497.1 unnamed protein product [Polarella glacialis]CAK0808105.1 unnamed protein product [Polarella glacialis]CAK0830174.1 unnamed protein product [Polarella glacialis]CAK0830175.1 unnamed protein product [Polarella glacialis]